MEPMEAPVRIGTQNPIEEMLKSIVQHAGAQLVFGEPVSANGKTILPVARLQYGFGGGSGSRRDGGQHAGGGGRLVSKPVGVFEITQSQTRFVPITSNWTLLAAIAVGICLGWLAVPRIR